MIMNLNFIKKTFFILATLSTILLVEHNTWAAERSFREGISKARVANLQSIPEIKADYVFGAGELAPGWKGMRGMKLLKDYFAPGVDAMRFKPETVPATSRVGPVMYWPLKKIKSGKYYIGLWLETGHARIKRHEPYTYESEYDPNALLTTIYLNGWPVRFSTSSDPVQVKPGLWVAELQSREAVNLKDDDEIEVSIPLKVWGSLTSSIMRLALYKKEPARGHGVTGQTFSVTLGTVQRVRLVIEPEISGRGIDGSELTAKIQISNPLPYPVDTVLDWKLADYYGAPLVEKSEPVHLKSHSSKLITYAFKAKGDDQAYQLDVRSRPAEGFSFPVQRPLEMLELSDYSSVEFQPNLPDPLTVRSHARIGLNDDRSGCRRELSLSNKYWKGWSSAWLDGRRGPDKIPEGLVFTPGIKPKKKPMENQLFGKWLWKKFTVPSWLRGEKYLIHLGKFSSEATVFMNGKLMGHRTSQDLPFTLDVSDALKVNGENELVICLRGAIALMNPGYIDKYDPHYGAHCRWKNKENCVIAGNSRTHYTKTKISSVSLLAVPGLRVARTLIVPDVEKQTLKIMTEIENLDEKKREVECSFEVFQNGAKITLPIPRIETTLTAGEKKELTVVANLDKGFFSRFTKLFGTERKSTLLTYTPAHPNLAKLVTIIKENNETVDVSAQRFAYRSIKVEGTNLTLNGENVKLFGTAGYNLASAMEGEDSIKVERCYNRAKAPQWNIDVFDEIGLFTYPKNRIEFLYPWKLLNNEAFWKSSQKYQVDLAWLYGSRPCVAGWHVSNESHYGCRYQIGDDGVKKTVERIASCVEAQKREVCPDAWFIADGDEDLNGAINFFSFHYLKQYRGGKTRRRAKPITFYPPDCYFFNNKSAVPPRRGELCRDPNVTGNLWTFGENAIGDTETMWFMDKEIGPAAARHVGDKATVSSACQFHTAQGMAHSKMTLDACRDMEMAYIAYVSWRDFFAQITQDVTFSMPEQQVRYYSGAEFDRRINIHDDEFSPGDLVFNWKLLATGGEVARKGQIKFSSGTSTLKRERIAFKVPDLDKREHFKLVMELWKNGSKRAVEKRLVDVWPSLKKKPSPDVLKDVFVYDPNDKVLPLFREIGYEAKSISRFDSASLADAKGVVIAPDAANEIMFSANHPLRKALDRGVKILLLSQKKGTLLEMGLDFDPMNWFSVGYIRALGHPVMKELKDVDFQMWNSDHLIARGAYLKPNGGSFTPLLDCCVNADLNWTPLIELYIGRGSIIASQLPLIADFKTEPMCAEILKRLIKYFHQPIFRKLNSKLGVLKGTDEKILKRLSELRVEREIVGDFDPKIKTTLFDIGNAKTLPDIVKVKEYLANGGYLIVHRCRPEHTEWLSSVSGKKVNIDVQPYASWADRLMLEDRYGVTAGLSNLDLYWRALVGGCHIPAFKQVSSAPLKERGMVNYIVKVEAFQDFFFPGGWLEVPVGKGKILFDQLDWETRETNFICGSPRRVVSLLMTNLGVRCTPPSPKPVLPTGVIYKPIDISRFANLSVKDEKKADSEGWCDWGPDQVLGDFPTGQVTFLGVPFLVPDGEKNAVSLKVYAKFIPSLEKHPETVKIPLNRKNVAGLVFLHTAGWAKGRYKYGERIMRYTDGSEEVIELNSTNTADWNRGRDKFKDEVGTVTRVAWKGSCKKTPVTRVYQTLWVNPHPEKEIEQIILTNKGLPKVHRSFIPLFAVTAAVLPKAKGRAVEASPENRRKARRLFQEAMKLSGEGKEKEAAGRLNKALKADNGNISVWGALAVIYAKTYTVKQFENFCHKWATATPESSKTWEVLGEFYDEKGLKRQAVEAYQKSLDRQWNQPKVMLRKNELEKELEK